MMTKRFMVRNMEKRYFRFAADMGIEREIIWDYLEKKEREIGGKKIRGNETGDEGVYPGNGRYYCHQIHTDQRIEAEIAVPLGDRTRQRLGGIRGYGFPGLCK